MASGNALRRRFDMLSFASFGVIACLALVSLIFQKHNFLTAAVVGIGWAGVAHGLAWGLAEIFAPGWVIQWRQRLISGDRGLHETVGRYFSEKLNATGDEPWKAASARRRLRLLGTFLTGFSLTVAAALIWIPEPLDRLYSALFHLAG